MFALPKTLALCVAISVRKSPLINYEYLHKQDLPYEYTCQRGRFEETASNERSLKKPESTQPFEKDFFLNTLGLLDVSKSSKEDWVVSPKFYKRRMF